MRRVFVPALLLLPIACSGAPYVRSGPPDYDRPFRALAAEYAVPVFLGKAMKDEVAGWDGHRSLRDFIQGITHKPVARDSDEGFVNYLFHPLAGSETHLIARKHGWSFGEAALFDAFGSLSWEYVFENVFEPPSKTDLMVTAPLGALLGELRYAALEAGILPGFMDPVGDHGEPFLHLEGDAILFGLMRRF